MSDAPVLVIGYGNELRRDDGLGPKLAAVIGQLQLPGVEVINSHQLTPELAEPVSLASTVIFLDAAVDSRGVEVRRLTSGGATSAGGHSSNPCTLLQLASELWGSRPAAWWITIPGFDFGFGETLSTAAQEQFSIGLEQVQNLLRRLRSEAEAVSSQA